MGTNSFSGRIVALSGFRDSGKSHVLKKVVEALKSSGWMEVAVRHYDGSTFAADRNTNEFISILKRENACIAIATGGDYPTTPCAVMKIISDIQVSLSIKIKLLICAARVVNPKVLDQYNEIGKNQHIDIKCVFKPGFKRTLDFEDSWLSDSEDLWVEKLIAEVKLEAAI